MMPTKGAGNAREQDVLGLLLITVVLFQNSFISCLFVSVSLLSCI